MDILKNLINNKNNYDKKIKNKTNSFYDTFWASEPIINNKANNFIYRINKNHKTRNKNISQINFFKNTIINLNSKSINPFYYNNISNLYNRNNSTKNILKPNYKYFSPILNNEKE